jgi:hypothetical protein
VKKCLFVLKTRAKKSYLEEFSGGWKGNIAFLRPFYEKIIGSFMWLMDFFSASHRNLLKLVPPHLAQTTQAQHRGVTMSGSVSSFKKMLT